MHHFCMNYMMKWQYFTYVRLNKTIKISLTHFFFFYFYVSASKFLNYLWLTLYF